MKPREQIMLASLAQERAYGKSESVTVGHVHGGSVELTAGRFNPTESLQRIADRLPERRAQQKVIEGQAIKAE